MKFNGFFDQLFTESASELRHNAQLVSLFLRTAIESKNLEAMTTLIKFAKTHKLRAFEDYDNAFHFAASIS